MNLSSKMKGIKAFLILGFLFFWFGPFALYKSITIWGNPLGGFIFWFLLIPFPILVIIGFLRWITPILNKSKHTTSIEKFVRNRRTQGWFLLGLGTIIVAGISWGISTRLIPVIVLYLMPFPAIFAILLIRKGYHMLTNRKPL